MTQAQHQVESTIMASLLYRQGLYAQRLQARLGTNSHLIRKLSDQLVEAKDTARIYADASVANAVRVRAINDTVANLDARLNNLSARFEARSCNPTSKT